MYRETEREREREGEVRGRQRDIERGGGVVKRGNNEHTLPK